MIAGKRDALHPEYITHQRRHNDPETPEGMPKPLPAPCLIDQLEVVAVIGKDFQIKWARPDFAQGLKVGDNLMAFVRPDAKAV